MKGNCNVIPINTNIPQKNVILTLLKKVIVTK